jgi:hypothetical protein
MYLVLPMPVHVPNSKYNPLGFFLQSRRKITSWSRLNHLDADGWIFGLLAGHGVAIF